MVSAAYGSQFVLDIHHLQRAMLHSPKLQKLKKIIALAPSISLIFVLASLYAPIQYHGDMIAIAIASWYQSLVITAWNLCVCMNSVISITVCCVLSYYGPFLFTDTISIAFFV